MASKSERERRNNLTVAGYVRMNYDDKEMDVPQDVVQMIFKFYHLIIYSFEYSLWHIKIKENTIINESDSELNTTVIGEWMDPKLNKLYNIKMIIDKQKRGCIGVGVIQHTHYDLNNALISYNNFNYFDQSWIDGASLDGDTVSMVLDSNNLSLSYKVLKTNGQTISYMIVPPGALPGNVKYKWAVSIYRQGGCITVLDIDVT